MIPVAVLALVVIVAIILVMGSTSWAAPLGLFLLLDVMRRRRILGRWHGTLGPGDRKRGFYVGGLGG